MSEKEIEKKILNYDIEISELEKYLEDYFDEVVRGMICALFVLLRHDGKNSLLIKQIIDEIEVIINDVDESELLDVIYKSIRELNYKIDNSLSSKMQVSLEEYRNKLLSICKNIKLKEKENNETDIVNIIRKLIYVGRDLTKIEAVLKSNKHLNNKNLEEIFSEILETYIYLTDEEEIKYYYKLIGLFLKSSYSKEIMAKSNVYLAILEKKKNLERVKSIIKQLQNKEISLEDLEKKYDIKFNSNVGYIPKEETCFSPRCDYTNQKVITIDDDGNKCNDDALYIEKLRDGSYKLYVHIADVPSLVSKDSYIDLMAYKKAETIYLKDREILLYPEIIAYDKGSLLGGTRKNVITYTFKLSPNLEIDPDSFTLTKGTIDIAKSFSYKEADKILRNGGDNDYFTLLNSLNICADILRNKNLYKNIYRNIENKMTGIKTNSFLESKSPSAKIVQETMVLTNQYVDKYFATNGYPYIHRVHNGTSVNIDEEIMLILGIDRKDLVNNPKCVKILNAVKEKYLNAEYSHISSPHNGIGVKNYSHSTSPLRRYADASGQYIIYDIVFDCNFDDVTIYKWENIVKESCAYLNERVKENALFANEYNYLVSKRKIRRCD